MTTRRCRPFWCPDRATPPIASRIAFRSPARHRLRICSGRVRPSCWRRRLRILAGRARATGVALRAHRRNALIVATVPPPVARRSRSTLQSARAAVKHLPLRAHMTTLMNMPFVGPDSSSIALRIRFRSPLLTTRHCRTFRPARLQAAAGSERKRASSSASPLQLLEKLLDRHYAALPLGLSRHDATLQSSRAPGQRAEVCEPRRRVDTQAGRTDRDAEGARGGGRARPERADARARDLGRAADRPGARPAGRAGIAFAVYLIA